MTTSATGAYTQGLREEHVLRSNGEACAWQRVVFHRLRREYRRLSRGLSTARAEEGLGMPRSAYWYIARLEPDYAYTATVSMIGAESGGTGVVCPFDTGGLWFDKITLAAPLSDSEKCEFLKAKSYSRDTYRPVMDTWLEDANEPEGDPFGGPVAMRLGVGESWSTVGRTRLG